MEANIPTLKTSLPATQQHFPFPDPTASHLQDGLQVPSVLAATTPAGLFCVAGSDPKS